MPQQDNAIRKRTQIAKASRMMFAWVAVASVVVSFSGVAAYFLTQKLVFNERVLFEKNKTISVLDANNKAVEGLQTAVRVLDTNEALLQSRANPADQAVRVILDALPSEANSLALGASVQSRLLGDIPSLSINTLTVRPVIGVEELTEEGEAQTTDEDDGAENYIDFSFEVEGPQASLYTALVNLERSIRTFHVKALQIENREGTQVMTVTARAYYEPAREIKLYDKVVEP